MASFYFLVVLSLVAAAVAVPPVKRLDGMEKALAPAREACKQLEPTGPDAGKFNDCYYLCVFKHFEAIDKDGRYVESKIADMLAALSIPDNVLTQEQVNQIAKTCNSVNDNIATGCQRATQVYQCVDDERFKITGSRY